HNKGGRRGGCGSGSGVRRHGAGGGFGGDGHARGRVQKLCVPVPEGQRLTVAVLPAECLQSRFA
ncbi:MAG: hypothetical protein K2O07_03080, partial [Alistipes sp.]|nr:hypothetical protein [Alistipes sp.]